MASLILLIIFGLGTAYFAVQNTGNVHILLGNFVLGNVPLYLVVIGSVLVGIFISWLISFVNTFSALFNLRGQEQALKKSQESIDKLQQQNHELELKVAQLKGESTVEKESKNEDIVRQPSVLQHIKQSFGLSSH